jgi:integrase
MASIYARGGKLWARLKGAREPGKWSSEPTPYAVGDEDKARRFAAAAQKMIDKRAATPADAMPTVAKTVTGYAKMWAAERQARGVGSALADLSRLETHAFPALRDLELADVKPKHARDLVRELRTNGKLAPRTIIHVHRTLRTMFESAVVDELIDANPIKAKPGDLPKKRDKDPTWRSQATYTVSEVKQLISDASIPVERRVQYALKALAGMRHGEVAALSWRAIDHEVEPLGRINVELAYDSKTRRIKPTKTEDTRPVPIHPTLGKILAAWKASHWERIYGRAPRLDDLVVPARTMKPVNAAEAGHAMVADLELLGLRTQAGAHRKRGGHDLRGWYKTRTIEDGADSLIIRRTTHAVPGDVNAGYERFSWRTICREVNKLQISLSDEEILPLATVLATAEKSSAKRWRYVATPTGFEPVLPA